MDLLNLHQPWDCQRFPKSKTICYGGGGGGGGGNPVEAVTKAVSDNTPTIKVEPPPPIKVDPPKLPKSTQDLVKGASTTIESVKKDVGSGIEKKKSLITGGVEQIKKEGSKIIEDTKTQIGTETEKLKKGDFSLKKAVQGTASGAAKTFKESDAGKVVKKIAKETGYTGSDADTGLKKIEKESSNIVNQTLDAVDNPTKVINDAVDRAKNFGTETAGEVKDAFGAYETAGKNIETTGQNIVGAFQDTFQTGMNAASALGQNLANQLGTASGDKGGLKGKANIADLLEQKRKGRRGGLSRSGTSRTLITGKV